jgi:hypothetical protein
MTADAYVTVSAQIPIKTAAMLNKLAEEYGLSRANMIMKIIEAAVLQQEEPIEVSTVTPEGSRDKRTGLAKRLNMSHRKLL